MKTFSIVPLLLLVVVPVLGIIAFFYDWSIIVFYICAGLTLSGSLGEWTTDKISFVCAVICVVGCVIGMHEPVIVEIAIGIMAASIANDVRWFVMLLTASR